MTTAYPLSWPMGWPRATRRDRAKFSGTTTRRSSDGQHNWTVKTDLTVAEARKRLLAELERIGASSLVMSSNLILNLDGSPRSSQAEPGDPGVAVYFKLKGRDRVMACDRWNRAADNIAAIAKHIEAIRGQARWGVGTLDQAFTGYAALPPPGGASKRDWRSVLSEGVPPPKIGQWTRDVAEQAYRRLIAQHHPDRGGDSNRAAEITAAYQEARAELRI